MIRTAGDARDEARLRKWRRSRKRVQAPGPLPGAVARGVPTRVDGVETLVVQDQRHGLADGRALCSAADLPSPALPRRRDGITFFTNDDDARRPAGDARYRSSEGHRRRRRPSTPARAALFQSGKVRHEAPGGDPACGCRRARVRRGRGPHGREARAAGPPHARRAVVAVESSTELPEEGARVGLAAAFCWHLVYRCAVSASAQVLGVPAGGACGQRLRPWLRSPRTADACG